MTESAKDDSGVAGRRNRPEVTRAAVQLLEDCASAFNHKFRIPRTPVWRRRDRPLRRRLLPPETLAGCRSADAILLGAIGGPKWDSIPSRHASGSGTALVCARNSASTSICGRFACVLRCEEFRRCVRNAWSIATSKSFASWRAIFISASTRSKARRTRLGRATSPTYSVPEIERVARYALRARRRPQPASDQRGQSQRTGHLDALAADGHGSLAKRISRASRSIISTSTTPRCRSCFGPRNLT